MRGKQLFTAISKVIFLGLGGMEPGPSFSEGTAVLLQPLMVLQLPLSSGLSCLWICNGFVVKTVLPLLDYFFTSVKNHLAILLWVNFWLLNFVPVIYMSVPLLISPSFNHCNYVIHFEIRKCDFYQFIFISQDSFGYSSSFAWPYKFQNNFVYIYQKSFWDFDGNFVKFAY